MKIIKDEFITNSMIKDLRSLIMSDERKVRKILGIDSVNLTIELPLNERDFQIWCVIDDNSKVIGYISFGDGSDGEAFIKSFYLGKQYRRKGFGKTLFIEFMTVFQRISCRINQGNKTMYEFAEAVGLKGEKMSPLSSGSGLQPVWWSNYKSEDEYV